MDLMQELNLFKKDIEEMLKTPKLNVYTLNTASKTFGVSKEFLKKGIEDGSLKYVKNGSRTYVTDNALEKFFESNKEYVWKHN